MKLAMKSRKVCSIFVTFYNFFLKLFLIRAIYREYYEIRAKLTFPPLSHHSGTQQGSENSRMYNEMVILKLVQSMTKLILSPPPVFREQILKHFSERGEAMYQRIKRYMDLSDPIVNINCGTSAEENDHKSVVVVKIKVNNVDDDERLIPPEFPLIPASRGFCLTLVGVLDNFYKKLQAISE